MLSDRRLFLSQDKARVVEADDPQAAFLLAGEGCEIMPDDVERFGLSDSDGRVVLPSSEPVIEKPKKRGK